MDQFHGPLHQKWLSFLSVIPEMSHSNLREEGMNCDSRAPSVSAEYWQSSDWELDARTWDDFDVS